MSWDEFVHSIPLLLPLLGIIKSILKSIDNITKNIIHIYEKRRDCVREERLYLQEKKEAESKNLDKKTKHLSELKNAALALSLLLIVVIFGIGLIISSKNIKEALPSANNSKPQLSDNQNELPTATQESSRKKIQEGSE